MKSNEAIFNFRCFKGVQGAVQHGTKIDRKLVILQWV
jgi:hypothetical protein